MHLFLSVDNPEFKFGKINQGENVEHTYMLTNSGKSDSAYYEK